MLLKMQIEINYIQAPPQSGLLNLHFHHLLQFFGMLFFSKRAMTDTSMSYMMRLLI